MWPPHKAFLFLLCKFYLKPWRQKKKQERKWCVWKQNSPMACDLVSYKQWLICLITSTQKRPVFDHPHYTTGILHSANWWTPSCISCNCRIFRNKLLGHDTDSWKRFQQNFYFEVILWLLLTSTWRICRSLWQLYRIKRQVFSPMLTFHRNSWFQLRHYSRIRILGTMCWRWDCKWI